nr:retrovirus-related Pol polyprotein from transposon TNT 1-94 [Tanacetum cinerariifolium]
MNSVINCLTTKSTWDDLILYHEGPSNVKESRVMDLKLCYNTFKFKEGESLTQTFTRYKALINELVNDGIKLSKLEINTGFINRLPKKWLSLCPSLRNTNNVKDFELASLFGKFKYEENLIDNIYETKKNKSLVSATPLSTAFFSSFIIQDFQDSPDDEEDTRSYHEYLNDLEEEYQARALLAKSKGFFKKGTQRSSQHKPELRPTKDIEAKYNKVKTKLAFLSSSSSASIVKNKGLIAEAYEWDEDEVSLDDNEMVEVKVLMTLAEENDDVSKEGARNDEWVKISMRKVHTLLEMKDNDDRKVCLDYLCIDLNYVEKQRTHDTKVTIPGVKRHWLSKAEGFILPNHDTGRILPSESQRNTTDFSVAVTDSSATDYDSGDESSICSIPLPPLKKLNGAEPISGPKTIKLILRLKSTFKAEGLKYVIKINHPQLLLRPSELLVDLRGDLPEIDLREMGVQYEEHVKSIVALYQALCEKDGKRICTEWDGLGGKGTEDPPVDPPEVPMADNQTMAKLLQAPTDGYEDAIVILEIVANNFELKHGLINLVQNKQFFRHDKEDSHAHIRYFNKITSTMRVPSVVELNDLVRALLLDKKNQSSVLAPSSTPTPVKAIEPNYVTCGGAHSYQNCPATSRNVYQDNIQEYVSQAAAANYN